MQRALIACSQPLLRMCLLKNMLRTCSAATHAKHVFWQTLHLCFALGAALQAVTALWRCLSLAKMAAL